MPDRNPAPPLAASAASHMSSAAASGLKVTATPLEETATPINVAEAPPKVPRYVPLGDAAPTNSTWLNDPEYMKLETYFAENQNAVPGLAASFGLNNLKPVLVKPDDQEGNTYLITNGTSFWMFNELEGRMWKFKDKSLKQEQVVDLVEQERYDGRDLAEQVRATTQP